MGCDESEACCRVIERERCGAGRTSTVSRSLLTALQAMPPTLLSEQTAIQQKRDALRLATVALPFHSAHLYLDPTDPRLVRYLEARDLLSQRRIDPNDVTKMAETLGLGSLMARCVLPLPPW